MLPSLRIAASAEPPDAMPAMTDRENQTATPRNAELVAARIATQNSADIARDIIAELRSDAARLDIAVTTLRAADFPGTANGLAKIAASIRANADRLEGKR